MTKVLIADDHQLFIEGILSILDDHKSIEIIGQANSGKHLLELLKVLEPQVLLLDINMPEMDGVAVMPHLKQLYPDLKIIVLTMYNELRFIEQMIQQGIDGYILKNSGRKEVEDAINTVMNGENFFSNEVMKTLVKKMNRDTTSSKEVRLTNREKDVLRLIAMDQSTIEIADKLCISTHTVETHRKNLLNKFSVRSSIGLVKHAIDSGLIVA